MPTTPNQPTTTPTRTPIKPPKVDDEPQVVTRGRVSHIEFSADQPEPMSVRPPHGKKSSG
jgi:hypothetical protein